MLNDKNGLSQVSATDPQSPMLHAIATTLSGDDLKLCWELAQRSALVVKAWAHVALEINATPDPLPLMLDWATAHYHEPLHLRRLLMAGDLEFQEEFETLQRRIRRDLHSLREGRTFRFAQSRADN